MENYQFFAVLKFFLPCYDHGTTATTTTTTTRPTSHQRKGRQQLGDAAKVLLGLICAICLSRLWQRVRSQRPSQLETSSSSSSSFTISSSSLTVGLNNDNATHTLPGCGKSTAHTCRTHQKALGADGATSCSSWAAERGKNLNIRERHTNSWPKTRYQLQHVYHNYYEDYDWFLKVPVDTYVIVENLQHFLQGYSPETPIYFLANNWEQIKQGHVSGAAGYVFSDMALHRFVNLGHGNGNLCSNRNYGIEHVEIASELPFLVYNQTK
ncbi:hypothetical protein ACLKA7_004860 [Drosophila subpalustris]